MSNDIKVVHKEVPRRLISMGDGTYADLIVQGAGDQGFYNGRQFRVSWEFSLDVASSQVRVLKFVSPVDFILKEQSLTCDQGGIQMKAWRNTQGTEGGTFGTNVPFYNNNFMDECPDYNAQVSLTTGGTFTPNPGQTAVETIRVLSNVSGAGVTAHRATVGGVQGGARGLPAGTYYLRFSILPAVSVDSVGIYTLLFEERNL